MKIAKLKRVIIKLDGYFGKPFDYKVRLSPALDVLIATKLSQNTTDKSSYKAFINLKKKFITWEEAANAGTNEIKECIKICGLANTKAKNIKKMLLEMKQNYGTLDLDFLKNKSSQEVYDELLKYDGIGVKTISCVLIFALGRDAFPVDTHVNRVLNRLGIINTKSAEKTFEKIKDNIPPGKMYQLHTNLIKFGRNICKAKSPLCGLCFLYSECGFKEKKIYRKKLPGKISENNFIILEHI